MRISGVKNSANYRVSFDEFDSYFDKFDEIDESVLVKTVAVSAGDFSYLVTVASPVLVRCESFAVDLNGGLDVAPIGPSRKHAIERTVESNALVGTARDRHMGKFGAADNGGERNQYLSEREAMDRANKHVGTVRYTQ